VQVGPGNLCGQYDNETVYLTCMLLDFCTLHLHFDSFFPSLGSQQETETAIWSGDQAFGPDTSEGKEDPCTSQPGTREYSVGPEGYCCIRMSDCCIIGCCYCFVYHRTVWM